MNKLNTRVVLAGVITLLTGSVFAGVELDAINAEVEKQTEQIDLDHGVLLSTDERRSLKLSLIANRVNTELPEATAKQKLDSAIEVYELTAPADQRQTLIDIMGNGGGKRPPCCGTVEN